MIGAVDVLVDRHDDVATTRAIHRLAATRPSVLAASIAPDWRDTPAVVWSILRALGKRSDKLAGATPGWPDAERWLKAHAITELVMLRAQHLKPAATRDIERLAARTGITVTLSYSGPDVSPRDATIGIGALIARAPSESVAWGTLVRWPTVPRSHALRLRYDCARRLASEDFCRVDVLLAETHAALDAWLTAHRHATRAQIDRTVAVFLAGHDREQRYIRRCAVQLGLLTHGIALPPITPHAADAQHLTDEQLKDVNAYTNATAAACRLAELTTGLPADLLGLIAGDQITETTILGTSVPASAQPVLRALGRRSGPLFPTHPARHDQAAPAGTAHRDTTSPAAPAIDHAFAAVLEQLLRGRANRINTDEHATPITARLDALHAAGILDLRRGGYHASHIALYSSFQLAEPPPDRLTSKWHDPLTSAGNTTDI